MTKGQKTLMLVGVGGQGLLMAARVLTAGLIRSGLDVRSSEVHGMAQRGGSVVTQLSFGKKVYSPVYGEGSIDYLLALEKLEALRYLHFLRNDGLLLINDEEIPSLPIITGQATYPENLIDRLERYDVNFRVLPAAKKAHELGNKRVANIIMLGALLQLTGMVDLNNWQDTVTQVVKPAYVKINQEALRTGMELVTEAGVTN